jgi:hypothetical protein
MKRANMRTRTHNAVTASQFGARFPLTLTLSPGERENQRLSPKKKRGGIRAAALLTFQSSSAVFPLPEGEGQGEGKRDTLKSAALIPGKNS